MKKSTLALAVASACFAMAVRVRAHTQDISYGFRMPTGFPGDPNRTHPFSILPGLVNATTPPRLFGDPVLIDTATNSYRGLTAADQSDATAINIDGIVVRPYPTQQTSGGLTATIGGGAPATNQPVDILREGYIMVKVNSGTPTKKGAVYVWCAASSGNHVLGGFETVFSAGNTVLVKNAFFNGPPGTDGVTEMEVFPANTIT